MILNSILTPSSLTIRQFCAAGALSRLWKRNSRLHVDIVIRHDLPHSVLLGNHLQQTGTDPPFVVSRYSRRTLCCTVHGSYSLENGNIRPYELQRCYILLERRILEDPFEDHFMLLEVARITCEKLASDVREGS